MHLKLRTRLFVVVAILLGASIAVSALLSRRATLVEVRAVVDKGPLPLNAAPILDRAESAARETPVATLTAALSEIEEETGRRVVAVDDQMRIAAASSRPLMNAQVHELTEDGTFIAELEGAGGRSAVQLRGAPTRRITAHDGRAMTIVVLPALDDPEPLAGRAGLPLWVGTTVATGIIAVPLVFAVARRILGPITALTRAAHRMQAGELDVRVDVRGGDEVADLGVAFNAMAARLAETERLRKQMVSDIAHELRSPVTNLRCTLESIQDGLVAADRTSIDALHEETELLQRLISDLQDLALAEAGQLTLHETEVHLGAVVRRAAGAAAASDAAPIHLDLPDRLPSLRADADRLEQVLRNLLQNARTHTAASGRIDVRVRCEHDFVRIDVTDNGRGIDPAHLPHVFDRFYRADTSRSRVTGGAGLGLAIVRQLVTAHGGRVEASSDGIGRGATFVVWIPIANT